MNLIALFGLVSVLMVLVSIVALIVQFIRKKEKKRWAIALGVSFLVFNVCSMLTPEGKDMSLISSEFVHTQETVPLNPVAEFGEQSLQLMDGMIIEDDGRQILVVSAIFKNNAEYPIYALSAFGIKAFQNGVEIPNVSNVNDGCEALLREVKDGRSLEVVYWFELENTFPVEVNVVSPTSGEFPLAVKEFVIGGADYVVYYPVDFSAGGSC